jgi:hypothetical protein
MEHSTLQEFTQGVVEQAKLESHHASRIVSSIQFSNSEDLVPTRADNVISQMPAIVYAMEHGEHAAQPDAIRGQVTALIESLLADGQDWRLQVLASDVFRYFELLEKFVQKERLQAWLAAYIGRITENGQYGGASTFRYFAALNFDRLQEIFANDTVFLDEVASFLGENYWVPVHAAVPERRIPEHIAAPRDLSADNVLTLPNVRTARGVLRAATTCSPQAEAYHNWTSLNTSDLSAQDRKYIMVDGTLIGSIKWGEERSTKQHSFLSFSTVRDEQTGTYPLVENALYQASAEVLNRVQETAGNVVHFSSADDIALMPVRHMEDSSVGSGTNYLERVRAVREVVAENFEITT